MKIEYIILLHRKRFRALIDDLLDGKYHQRTDEISLGTIVVDGTVREYKGNLAVNTSFRSGQEEPTSYRLEAFYLEGNETKFHGEGLPSMIRYDIDDDVLTVEYKKHGKFDPMARFNRLEIKIDVNSDLVHSYYQYIDDKSETVMKTYSRMYDRKDQIYKSRLHYPYRDHDLGPTKIISFWEDGVKEREYLYMTSPISGSALHRTNGPAYEYNRAGMTVRKAGAFYYNGEDITSKFGYHTWQSDTDEDMKDFAWMMAMGEDRPTKGYVQALPGSRNKSIKDRTFVHDPSVMPRQVTI